MSSQLLASKRALVTGGSRGIGAAIVRRLVEDGATVTFTYRSSPDRARDLVAELGRQASAIHADSGDPEQLREAVARAADLRQGLDILVNSAGILIGGPIDDYRPADLDRMIDVNVKAVFHAVRAALPHMGRGGRIVNIGSVGADVARFPGASVYALTKGAVASFTRGLAHDLGPRGITANTVQPGPTTTDIVSAKVLDGLRPLLPVGRPAHGREIASLVAWLCGDDAAFVTGAALTVDGGYSA